MSAVATRGAVAAPAGPFPTSGVRLPGTGVAVTGFGDSAVGLCPRFRTDPPDARERSPDGEG